MIVNPLSSLDISAKIKNTAVTELKEGSVLLFSKTSKFPRFKLESTSFKRCIKLDKADCVVIGKFDQVIREHRYILEGEKNYYIVLDALPTYYHGRTSGYINEYADDWYAFFQKRPFMFEEGVTPKKLYENVSYCTSKDIDILYSIMTDQITKTISDEALDKIVSGTLSTLDEDSFRSIKEMIESPDKETAGLGLRILSGYNIIATYTAVRILLGLNYYSLIATKEWNTVGVQQMVKKFNFGSGVNNNINSLTKYCKFNAVSELDIKLCEFLLKDAIKKYFIQCMSDLNNAIAYSGKYNFKVSVNVE